MSTIHPDRFRYETTPSNKVQLRATRRFRELISKAELALFGNYACSSRRCLLFWARLVVISRAIGAGTANRWPTVVRILSYPGSTNRLRYGGWLLPSRLIQQAGSGEWLLGHSPLRPLIVSHPQGFLGRTDLMPKTTFFLVNFVKSTSRNLSCETARTTASMAASEPPSGRGLTGRPYSCSTSFASAQGS